MFDIIRMDDILDGKFYPDNACSDYQDTLNYQCQWFIFFVSSNLKT
ncbi:MAG: hypothetical protein ABH806_00040 [Candidatus Omnitrophota bacterium]